MGGAPAQGRRSLHQVIADDPPHFLTGCRAPASSCYFYLTYVFNVFLLILERVGEGARDGNLNDERTQRDFVLGQASWGAGRGLWGLGLEGRTGLAGGGTGRSCRGDRQRPSSGAGAELGGRGQLPTWRVGQAGGGGVRVRLRVGSGEAPGRPPLAVRGVLLCVSGLRGSRLFSC